MAWSDGTIFAGPPGLVLGCCSRRSVCPGDSFNVVTSAHSLKLAYGWLLVLAAMILFRSSCDSPSLCWRWKLAVGLCWRFWSASLDQRGNACLRTCIDPLTFLGRCRCFLPGRAFYSALFPGPPRDEVDREVARAEVLVMESCEQAEASNEG